LSLVIPPLEITLRMLASEIAIGSLGTETKFHLMKRVSTFLAVSLNVRDIETKGELSIAMKRIRSTFYTREGNPIFDSAKWAKIFESSDRIITQTNIAKNRLVSTVWLGIDHNFGSGEPLIFETMVFDENRAELDIDRYSTEVEAKAGHAAMVAKWNERSS